MGERIAVITPYCGEEREVLRRCHESVAGQEVEAHHFLIADGFPDREVQGWDARHVILPQAHGDNGNLARGIGSLLARAEGYDFIAWLDADNWFHAGHLQSLLALHRQTGSPVCAALRSFHDPAGAPLGISEDDEDALRHVDTSCYLIARPVFDIAKVWIDMPKILSPICDRVLLAAIRQRGLDLRSTGQRTVAFRSRYAAHYLAAGAAVPPGAKDAGFAAAAMDYLSSPQGVSECVAALGFWPPSFMPG